MEMAVAPLGKWIASEDEESFTFPPLFIDPSASAFDDLIVDYCASPVGGEFAAYRPFKTVAQAMLERVPAGACGDEFMPRLRQEWMSEWVATYFELVLL